MLAASEAARQSIDLEQFILVPDAVGRQFLELLARQAQNGVRVRLLCDAAGSLGLFHSPWPELLRRHGAEILPFNSLFPGSAHNQRLWFFRDHQKLLVIDDRIAFTGGICLGGRMTDWRDTHVEVRGPVVGEMSARVEEMWRRAAHRSHRRRQSPLAAIGRREFAYLPHYPIPGRRQLYRQFLTEIRASRFRVYLTTAYFVPEHRLRQALESAAQRGVEVRVLLPAVSDHSLVDRASQSYFTPLLKAGVKIHRYRGIMLHAKTAVIDGNWATVGSLNLDHLSTLYNFEANLVSTNAHFIRDLIEQFAVDLKQAKEVTLAAWRRRSLLARLLELCVRPLRPFL